MTTQENRFDQAAAGWDKKQRRVELADAVAGAIAALPLNSTMKAMEYGSGTGLVGLRIAPLVHHLTAVDTSTGMLDVLQTKLTREKIGNVTPRCLDLTRELCLERYDLIFSSMTLHHIDDAQRLLAVFADLLLPGGILALADLDREDGSFHKPDAPDVHHHGFDRQELRHRFTELGFRDIAETTVHTFDRIDKEGTRQQYRVFLLSGKKPV